MLPLNCDLATQEKDKNLGPSPEEEKGMVAGVLRSGDELLYL